MTAGKNIGLIMQWQKTTFRIEQIKVKGEPDYFDTVAYTNIGPVCMIKVLMEARSTNNKYYAVRWKAHDPSNELKMFTLLDKAKNYDDYLEAIKYLHTPGQNCVFAMQKRRHCHLGPGRISGKMETAGRFCNARNRQQLFMAGNDTAGRKSSPCKS